MLNTQPVLKSDPWSQSIRGAALLLLLALLLVPILARTWQPAQTFTITFISIMIEAVPFVVLGSLVAGLIEVFLSADRLAKLLPRSPWVAIPFAALGGMVLPVCECAVVPVTRRLIAKGMPLPVAMAYLLAAPIVNPLVLASTAVAYAGDARMVVLRGIGGYTCAIAVALIIWAWFGHGRKALRDSHDAGEGHTRGHVHTAECGHDHSGSDAEHGHHHGPEAATLPLSQRLIVSLRHAADEFVLVGTYLAVGALIAAAIHTGISRQSLVSIADAPIAATLSSMAMAFGLNLCSEADAFVAASFRDLLPFVAQLGFLVLGPMMDVKLASMYLSFLKRRTVLIIVPMVCVVVFTFVMVIHLTIGASP